MTAVGIGPAAPLASNDNEDGQAKNRRVEAGEDVAAFSPGAAAASRPG